MKTRQKVISGILLSLLLLSSCAKKELTDSANIRVRDPFILVDNESKTYYLYASRIVKKKDSTISLTVGVYVSKDLKMWEKPKTVFEMPDNFWGKKAIWAPEVHKYKGKYYLFTTFTSTSLLDNPPSMKVPEKWPPYYKRATQILVAESPFGPFVPFQNAPHITDEDMTLDGTLWVEDDIPYLIYCHEWVQIKDGTMNLVALEDDLSAIKGTISVLFKASDAQWIRPIKKEGFITDGCYLYRTKTGKLLMIWSSQGADKYAIGIVESESGKIQGPWKHQKERLFKKNGGHGMIFKTLEGELALILHQPNFSPKERMQIYKLKDVGHTLRLDGKLNN